jgi:hypothetical protein
LPARCRRREHFTDLLLIDEKDGATFSAKVPSTPADPSIAVRNGIAQICEHAAIDPREVTHATVATNSACRLGIMLLSSLVVDSQCHNPVAVGYRSAKHGIVKLELGFFGVVDAVERRTSAAEHDGPVFKVFRYAVDRDSSVAMAR